MSPSSVLCSHVYRTPSHTSSFCSTEGGLSSSGAQTEAPPPSSSSGVQAEEGAGLRGTAVGGALGRWVNAVRKVRKCARAQVCACTRGEGGMECEVGLCVLAKHASIAQRRC